MIFLRCLRGDGNEAKSRSNKTFLSLTISFDNRELKIYDATVAKTSLKIASSSFSIYFAIMSVCLTFDMKASGTTKKLNLEVQCQREKRIFKFAPECSRSL